MEFAKNSFMGNVDRGKHVLILMIRVKLKHAKNMKRRGIVLTEKDAILVMI